MLIRASPTPGDHWPVSENCSEDSRIFKSICRVARHRAVDCLGHILRHVGRDIPQRARRLCGDNRKRAMEVDPRRELVGGPSRQEPVCTSTERVNIAPYAGRGRPPIRSDLGSGYRWSSHEWGHRARSMGKQADTAEIANHALALAVEKQV
jgi:hypothetical protein